MAPSPHPQHRHHRHPHQPEELLSFGAWLRQRRRALDLTQEELAQRVGCARITVRRIEADELKPSQQLAELLASHLGVTTAQRHAWLSLARGLEPLPQSPPIDLPAMTPATPKGPPTNLPAPLTSFLGRDHEIVDGYRLLTTSRLLTLTGVGGAGKTRLALEMARAILDFRFWILDSGVTDNPKSTIQNPKFPDGIWWVELAPLTDAGLIPEAVAKVVGLREQPGQPLDRLLLEMIKSRRLLLLLDNCEHLAAGCAAWVHQWLRASPHLHILATSREPLQLLGEQRFPVAPLAAAAASDLFVQRAQLVDPAFMRTDANGAAIDQLCQQVDYLPLAIELLAAHSDHFSPQALVEGLQARPLDLLSAEMRDLPARQRTLRQTIQHSYDLLTEGEQRLFRTLGVFVGGFDGAAVMHLGFAEELLYALLNKGLVQATAQADGERRFTVLETLRAYANEQLNNSQEEQLVRERHAHYFLEMAEHAYRQLGYAAETTCYDQLEREHDNLRAALGWALTANPPVALQMAGALREFWCIRGYYTEGRQWSTQALEQNPPSPSSARGRALLAAGKSANLQGDLVDATTFLEEALRVYSQVGDQSGMAYSLYFLGNLARQQDDLLRSKSLLEQSLALQRALGDSHGSSSALCDLGMIAMNQGDPHGGRALLEEGLAIARAANNENRVAMLHARFANFELHQRAPHAARSHFRESIQLALRYGHLVMIAYCLSGLAKISGTYSEEGEAKQKAVRLLSASDALGKTISHPFAHVRHPDYQRSLDSVRLALDEATFAQAWDEGQTMTLEEAVAYALAL
ncbi:MAG: helix-turn-helix domain-containing protein [Caldilineaceae bacterium]|nr:helix-turn-helix domain-containing protein [Caldilineaceae bacterium]